MLQAWKYRPGPYQGHHAALLFKLFAITAAADLFAIGARYSRFSRSVVLKNVGLEQPELKI
jgi:hypothetical protein